MIDIFKYLFWYYEAVGPTIAYASAMGVLLLFGYFIGSDWRAELKKWKDVPKGMSRQEWLIFKRLQKSDKLPKDMTAEEFLCLLRG